MKKLVFILTLFLGWQTILGQIDTSVTMPLGIGTFWEWDNRYAIVVDTVSKNQKTYSELYSIRKFPRNDSNDTIRYFFRLEDNILYGFYDFQGLSGEKIWFNPNVPAGGLWGHDTIGSVVTAHRNSTIGYKSYYWSSIEIPYYFVEEVLIDLSTTPPDTMIIMDTYFRFLKGIGWEDNLSGFRINGVEYGYITVDIEEDDFNTPFHQELKMYPNPFNNECTITFSSKINMTGYLSIYDIVGNLVMDKKSWELHFGMNEYYLKFPSQLSSGVYFIVLKTERSIYTYKSILIK